VFRKVGIPQADRTRNGEAGACGRADWKRSENHRRRTIGGKAEDFALEVYAMNCAQRTGRRSFCDRTDTEDTESTFSKRLPPDLPDLCDCSFERSNATAMILLMDQSWIRLPVIHLLALASHSLIPILIDTLLMSPLIPR
jgi:hypothetical protein